MLDELYTRRQAGEIVATARTGILTKDGHGILRKPNCSRLYQAIRPPMIIIRDIYGAQSAEIAVKSVGA